MRILLLTPQRPYPPHQGTTLRNFNLIKELAKRHSVSLLTFLEPDQNSTDHGPLLDFCQQIETVPVPQRSTQNRLQQMITTSRPDMSWRLWSPVFAERLARYLDDNTFDVVEIEGIEMTPYLDIIKAARPQPLIVYDAHNAEWILQKRAFLADIKTPARWVAALYSWVQWRRLYRYEAEVLKQVDHTIAMSYPDKAALHEITSDVSITVVPNGVDLDAYRHFRGDPIHFDLIFTGKMDFRPNIDAALWFGQHVLPLIQTARPQTTFAIVGQRPHPRLDVLRDNPGITITGFVDDIRPYIAGATIYVVPLRVGGGTRLKIMEALAMGKPIVSTSVGAEGFPVVNGKELILADEPAAFAQAVVKLMSNPMRRLELGRTGRALAHANYGWETLVPRLERIYYEYQKS
ncbi:MAG: glycosyltransferase [Anaerolineae bacterium]|nr:glycosyltransferase [Anaerolineae bacterium]